MICTCNIRVLVQPTIHSIYWGTMTPCDLVHYEKGPFFLVALLACICSQIGKIGTPKLINLDLSGQQEEG